MKFIDEVTIRVQAGKGGDGCCSFRREKFIPWGGPDGGDGGSGGSVYIKATSRLNTLTELNYRKDYVAEKGQPGGGNLCSGKSGLDLIIYVPLGTVVFSEETKEKIGDLDHDGQLLVVANGGRGGLGNNHFKSSVNRSPRKVIRGELGEERTLRLELRLLADVGLLGFPNVGKSTLISSVSSAKPKIADYPFTTLRPHLGVVSIDGFSFIMADIPGLIEGAASGSGLGVRFLKHLSRNKLLLHMIDLSHFVDRAYTDQTIVENLLEQIKIIEAELSRYNDSKLINITRWIVVNKIDLLESKKLNKVIKKFDEFIKVDLSNNFMKVFWISAIKLSGVNVLSKEIANYLKGYNGKH